MDRENSGRDVNGSVSGTVKLAIKSVEKFRSKQSWIEAIKYRILFHKTTRETLDTLNNLTLDELLDLNEQIEIQEFIEAAHHAHITKNTKTK